MGNCHGDRKKKKRKGSSVTCIVTKHLAPPINRPLLPLPFSQQAERTQQPTRDITKELATVDWDERYDIESDDSYETNNPEEKNNNEHVYENKDTYFQRERSPVTCFVTKHLAPPIGKPLPPLPLSQQAERTQQPTSDITKELTSDELDERYETKSDDLDERYETESDDNQTKDDADNENTDYSFQIAIEEVQPFRHLATLPPNNDSMHDQQDVKMTIDEEMGTEYRKNLLYERETIIQNIKTHDILSLLPFLENHDDIYAVAKYSEKNAVRMIIDKMEQSNQIENWCTFIDALEKCGYSFVVDTIRGFKFRNHEKQKDHLKQVTSVISKMIYPPELMPHLIDYDLITDTDREKIDRECNNNGAIVGALELLQRIPKINNDWYISFIKALEKADYEHVAKYLIKEHLMENERYKDNDGYYCIRHICSWEEIYTQLEQPRTQSNHSNPKLIHLEKERNELRQKKSGLNLEAEVFKRAYSDLERKIGQLEITTQRKEDSDLHWSARNDR